MVFILLLVLIGSLNHNRPFFFLLLLGVVVGSRRWHQMRSLKMAPLLCAGLSSRLIDSVQTQVTIELLSLCPAFGPLHRRHCIQDVILVVLESGTFGSVKAFAVYSRIEIVFTFGRLIEYLLYVRDLYFLITLVRFFGVIRNDFFISLDRIRRLGPLVVFQSHLRRVHNRVFLPLNFGLHQDRTLRYWALEVAVRKSARIFVLVLIDGLSVGANATLVLLIFGINFTCTVYGVLSGDLDIITCFIQNHCIILEVRLGPRAFRFRQILLPIQRETTWRIWPRCFTLNYVELLIELATV